MPGLMLEGAVATAQELRGEDAASGRRRGGLTRKLAAAACLALPLFIPGLAAGRYDLGASSFTDTKEREKTVDFVTYYSAGISFYAKSSSNPGVTKLADLCGKTVGN